MKKMVLVLGLMLCFGLALEAQVNFKQAIDEGTKKMKVREPDFAAARADFTKALELASNDSEKTLATINIADTYYRGREYEKARAEDAKILGIKGSTAKQKIDAQFRIAESFMGYRFQEKPDYARSRAEYAKVLNMEGATPDDKAKAVFGMGDSYATEKKYAQARAEYAKIVQMKDIKPEMKVEAQYNIGADYRAEGNFDMAKAEWAKILKMDEATPEYKEKVEQRIRTVYW